VKAVPSCSDCPNRMESIFCGLSPERLAQLNAAKTANFYERGQKLYYEGNPPKGIFCVADGHVKVYKSGADGKETILRLAGPGDVLGYRSLLSEAEHGSTAEVIEAAAICFIDRHVILSFSKDDPELAFNIIRRLSSELAASESRISNMVNKDVRERLSELLLVLKTTSGKPHAEGVAIDVRLTRSELASMIGATSETVIRLLSAFQEEGYVALEGKRIIVRNADGLLAQANLDA
jgi:CRP-like cAMP-binding protein